MAQVIETYIDYAILLVMMCAAGFLLPILLRYRGRLRGAINLSFWFNNSLFMGLPLVQGVYGDQAVVYMTLFFIPVNLLFFIYGVSSISIHKRRGLEMFRMLLNPGIIASLIACVIYFGEIPTHPLLMQAFSMLGAMTAPLAMMMIGASLKDIHMRHMLTDRKLLVYTFLKAVVLPIPILFLMKLFVTNPYILGCSLVIVAAPTGGMVAMVALLYNKVAYPLMTEIIALSTGGDDSICLDDYGTVTATGGTFAHCSGNFSARHPCVARVQPLLPPLPGRGAEASCGAHHSCAL